jgi:thioredoxin reductase
MPESFRLQKVRNVLGPAPGWFMKDQVVGKIPLHLGATITKAEIASGRVRLELTDPTGARNTIEADHVIAGTGYRVDLRRLTFLDPNLLSAIREVEHTPKLSAHFESSVPGLYFVGAAAANTFGPLMRFAFGAGFAANRVAARLARSSARGTVRETAANAAKQLDSRKTPRDEAQNEIGVDA